MTGRRITAITQISRPTRRRTRDRLPVIACEDRLAHQGVDEIGQCPYHLRGKRRSAWRHCTRLDSKNYELFRQRAEHDGQPD
jgi:hypothetical protein